MEQRKLFFDAGPIITLVLSGLTWILPELKKKFGGNFYITPSVKFELVDRPLNIKRFKFEALQVMKLIKEGTIEVYNDVPKDKSTDLKKLANRSFRVGNKSMDVIQAGEIESVTSVLKEKDSAIVMDERTLRLLIEDNREVKSLLKRRFHRKIEVDKANLDKFSKELKGISIIRSVELLGVAYKLGLFNSYIPPKTNGRRVLVDSLLWTAKYNGCAMTDHEVEELKEVLLSK